MIDRKKVPVDREIVVVDNSREYYAVTSQILVKAISAMKDGEELVSIRRKHGNEPAPFANDPDETIWVDQIIMTVRSFRPETDDEYFKRMKKLEDDKVEFDEKEKIEYLRLKAKFEST